MFVYVSDSVEFLPCNPTTWSERLAWSASTSSVYRNIGHNPSTGSDSSQTLA